MLYVSYEIGLAVAPPEPDPEAVPFESRSLRGFADLIVLFLKIFLRNICIGLCNKESILVIGVSKDQAC